MKNQELKNALAEAQGEIQELKEEFLLLLSQLEDIANEMNEINLSQQAKIRQLQIELRHVSNCALEWEILYRTESKKSWWTKLWS